MTAPQLPARVSADEIRRIVVRHGGSRPRVFGSRARGDASPSSDLDLLIDLEAGRDLFDLIALKQELEDYFGGPVDVLTEAALSPYLRERILAEARPL